jgi:hypothetical protein
VIYFLNRAVFDWWICFHFARPLCTTGWLISLLQVANATQSSFTFRFLRKLQHTYLLIYLLTPCSRVLLEKLTGFQLVKKFPAFYWIRRFITAFTGARHLSLSLPSSIQSIPPHHTSWISTLISSHLRLGLPRGLSPSGFPTKPLYTPSPTPIRAKCPAHLILLYFITRITFDEEYRSWSSSLWSFLHSPVTASLLGGKFRVY